MYSPQKRLLLGPGPSNVAPSVLKAMSSPLIGHLDADFIKIMEEIKSMLRLVFKTENEMTFPISGTGSAGMETCFVNLVEPGDEVVIGVNGVFGMRMCDVAERCGANVKKVEAEWGKIIEPAAIEAALKKSRPKLVAIVHLLDEVKKDKDKDEDKTKTIQQLDREKLEKKFSKEGKEKLN